MQTACVLVFECVCKWASVFSGLWPFALLENLSSCSFNCIWRTEMTTWKSDVALTQVEPLVSHSCFVIVSLQHCPTYQIWTHQCFYLWALCMPTYITCLRIILSQETILFLSHLPCWQTTEWQNTCAKTSKQHCKLIVHLLDLIQGTVIVSYCAVHEESSAFFRSSNSVSLCVFQVCLWIRTETPWALHTADSESC